MRDTGFMIRKSFGNEFVVW